MDDVMLDRREINDFGERIAHLVGAIVETKQSDLAVADLSGACAGERQDRLADLNPELTRGLIDCGSRHFLYSVDHGEAQRPPSAVEPAEQQYRGRFRYRSDGALRNSCGAFLGLSTVLIVLIWCSFWWLCFVVVVVVVVLIVVFLVL